MCDLIAARRLLPLEVLEDAVRCGQGLVHHTDVEVDAAMLLARVRALTDAEKAVLARAAEGFAA